MKNLKSAKKGKSVMNYPFYTWFSVIGILIQFVRTAIKIIFVERPLNIGRWVLFCTRLMIVSVGFIVLPAGLMLIPLDMISQYNATLGNVYNLLILVVLYVMGVLAARNLYRWEQGERSSF